MRNVSKAVLMVLALTQAMPALAQSTLGCDPRAADAYENLAATTRSYILALGPNLQAGNYPADMREEVTAFTEERIELYRRLQQFEDFAYQVRRCSRK